MRIKTKSGRSIRLPSHTEEAAIRRGIKADPDNPEWTEEDFREAIPFSALPESLQTKLRRVRGAGKKPLKVQTAIRFDPDVLAALRATGRGWQTRVNDVMRKWVEKHAR
jgi:uncharacterized protein (DUF4415 family)